MKRGGGRRYYRPADVALLKGIRVALYDQGLTIKGLQKLFRERGPRHVVALGESNRHEVDEPAVESEALRLNRLIGDLVAVRDRLRRA
jgi:DNA-binding transcriptional MerR regulator